MKGFKALLATMMLGALVSGFNARAQGPDQGPGPGFGMHRPPMERALGSGPAGRWWNDSAMVEKLNLSDDQRKNMDEILLQHREQLIDMRAAVEKSELALEPLMSADQPNEQQVLAQIDKVAQARAELEKANARFLLAIRAKLTPDQWKQLQAARAERHQMRQNGPGPDGMPPRHRMRNLPGPDGVTPGGPQGAPPPPAPGPQGMIPQERGPDFGPGLPPSLEAGAIE